MERVELELARSRPRRSAKRKDKAAGGGKKSAVSPVRFKLHTEVLAEKRNQQREEKEVAQLRHAQQKILGKKTVEEFAQLKLIRREPATTRSRSLHCNGKTLNLSRRGKECELHEANDRVPKSTVRLETRPLMSARLSNPLLVSDSLPQRPQSAKPVLQSQYRPKAAHDASLSSKEEDELLDSSQCKAHSKKKRKKKTSERKSGGLTPSKSAPEFPDRPDNSPIGKKINIFVNMRSLQLVEEQESPDRASPPVKLREAWGVQPLRIQLG
ncbi:hypothetical protein PHYPSEUDO_003818 [Phytophthora pseudosyringae]|uniref:Uncharacterized protein n=1 Tax=Phytophthora pseudosyringae TaxID=221518 RepID=A0A8T1WIF8_9STRA|nr:hypothetical protein PHYPSEUDO_003818 [Phytophthora pseudosyringae]